MGRLIPSLPPIVPEFGRMRVSPAEVLSHVVESSLDIGIVAMCLVPHVVKNSIAEELGQGVAAVGDCCEEVLAWQKDCEKMVR